MGLAPYGEPIYADLIKQKLIAVADDGSFQIDMSFFDYATGSSLPKESYISAGIKLGPLIIPLYQNWEEKNKIPNNFEWIKERVRFIWVFSRVSFF